MTTAKFIEYRITRQLAEGRDRPAAPQPTPLVRHLICAAALAGAMLLLGSAMPELLGALLGGAALTALGSKKS